MVTILCRMDLIAAVCQHGNHHTAWQQTRVIPVTDLAAREEMATATRVYEIIS
jgi:hypothetical protein